MIFLAVVYGLGLLALFALAGVLVEGASHRRAGLRLEHDLREHEHVPVAPALRVVRATPHRAHHRHAA